MKWICGIITVVAIGAAMYFGFRNKKGESEANAPVPVVATADKNASEVESEGAGNNTITGIKLLDGRIVVIQPAAETEGVEKVMPSPKEVNRWVRRVLPDGSVREGWQTWVIRRVPTAEKGQYFNWEGYRYILTEAPPALRVVAKKPNPCGAAAKSDSCAAATADKKPAAATGGAAPPAPATSGAAVSVTGSTN